MSASIECLYPSSTDIVRNLRLLLRGAGSIVYAKIRKWSGLEAFLEKGWNLPGHSIQFALAGRPQERFSALLCIFPI